MKKMVVFVFLLVLALACAAPPTNRETAETNRNANTAAEPTTPPLTESDAIAKEKAIWDTIKNKDYDAFAAMLADEQIEVLDSGVQDKAGSIAGVKQFEVSEVNFADWKFLPIDKDAVILVYTVNYKGKYQGKPFPPASSRSSSAWVHRGGKWVAMYHQECPVKTTPPPPPPKTTPSPSTTPGGPITTTSDAVANEKAIWEALKARNFDGFAGALAADSLEVEPDGVYDKAGSVKGVQGFDFSKSVLSDFRFASFDADATLVTYTTKLSPSMPAERHSTIWANRAGKWVAVFHHGGTPVAPAPSPSPASSVPKPSTSVSPAK